MGKIWNSTLTRYKPLPKATKPLARATKPIAKRSAKKIREDAIYFPLAKKFKEQYPECQAKLEGCCGQATEVHHTKGRGKWYLIVRTWLAVCWRCHRKLTDDSKLAYSKGLSQKRLTKSVKYFTK